MAQSSSGRLESGVRKHCEVGVHHAHRPLSSVPAQRATTCALRFVASGLNGPPPPPRIGRGEQSAHNPQAEKKTERLARD
jgi:hypothetical protein